MELRSPMYHYELVKRAISMSLDEKEKERELVSRLLSSLYPKVVNAETMGKGFERLFELVDELSLDAPKYVIVVPSTCVFLSFSALYTAHFGQLIV